MSQPAIFKFPHPDAAARARHSASESWLRRPAAGRSDARRHCDRTTGQRRDQQSASYRLPLAMSELPISLANPRAMPVPPTTVTVTGNRDRQRPLGLGVRPAGVTVRLGSS
jgi:hypothetical protein